MKIIEMLNWTFFYLLILCHVDMKRIAQITHTHTQPNWTSETMGLEQLCLIKNTGTGWQLPARCREQDQAFGFTVTISFCSQTLKGGCSLCFMVQGMKMSTTLLSDRTVRDPRFYHSMLRVTTCGFIRACKRHEADSEMKMLSSQCEHRPQVSFLVRVPSQPVRSGLLQLEPWKASASYSIL